MLPVTVIDEAAGEVSAAIVDAHVHVWDDPARYRHPIAPSDVRSDVDRLVALQEATGVTHAVIVQGSADPYEYKYMLRSAQRFPGRFALVGHVDPRAPNAAEYVQACPDRGLSGVRIPAASHPDAAMIADPRADGLWEVAEQHRIALCLHMVANQAGQANVMLDRHPETRVVIDHMGLPMRDGRPAHHLIGDVAALSAFPHVFVKLSAFPVLAREPYPHRDALRLVAPLMAAFGPSRLMWGTDFPYIQRQCGYPGGLRLVTDHLPTLSPADRTWILGETARSIFRFI